MCRRTALAERNLESDARAPAHLGLDLEIGPHGGGPLAHPQQPQAGPGIPEVVGLETPPIILDAQDESIALGGGRELDPFRPAVAHRVGEGLLCDPVGGQRQIERKALDSLEGEVHEVGRAALPNVGPERGFEPDVLELGRPQPPGDPPYAVGDVVELLPEPAEFGHPFLFARGTLGEPRPQDEGRQALRGVVVQLARDPPPLFFGGSHGVGAKVSQAAAFRQVADHGHDQEGPLPFQGAQRDLDGYPRTVFAQALKLHADAHGSATRRFLECPAVVPVAFADFGGDQSLHLDPDQLARPVSEEPGSLRIRFPDPAVRIHEEDAVGCVLEDGAVRVRPAVGKIPTVGSGSSRLPPGA